MLIFYRCAAWKKREKKGPANFCRFSLSFSLHQWFFMLPSSIPLSVFPLCQCECVLLQCTACMYHSIKWHRLHSLLRLYLFRLLLFPHLSFRFIPLLLLFLLLPVISRSHQCLFNDFNPHSRMLACVWLEKYVYTCVCDDVVKRKQK